jgi:hypothetical protein
MGLSTIGNLAGAVRSMLSQEIVTPRWRTTSSAILILGGVGLAIARHSRWVRARLGASAADGGRPAAWGKAKARPR